MSFAPRFQIASDLHLETPLPRPRYTTFKPPLHTNNLLLLGDIGSVKDPGLFEFLRHLLQQTPNLRIFYALGNHEAYYVTHSQAVNSLRAFERQSRRDFGERFIFLHRTRFDVSERITILGCTLWTRVSDKEAGFVAITLTDFDQEKGIHDWSLASHMEEHAKDLEWLNSQVQEIERNEPDRQVIIATHHSPTIDSRASDPRHEGKGASSGFQSDLSKEKCWTSKVVKVWAFGHTHFNCVFRDSDTEKWVVTNQGGYGKLGRDPRKCKLKPWFIEASEDKWEVLTLAEENGIHDEGGESGNMGPDWNTEQRHPSIPTPKRKHRNWLLDCFHTG